MSLSKDDFKIEKVGNTATCVCTNEEAFYEGDLTKKQIKEVFDHSQSYLNKCAEVTAEVATSIMGKDKAIDNVLFNLPYGVSKRGCVDVKTRRTVTFPGIGTNPDVTRSDLRMVVKDPLTKVGKTKLKDLQANMTAELLK